MMTHWYRVEIKVSGMLTPFVDWYTASDSDEALMMSEREEQANGIPSTLIQSRTVRRATDKEASALG